MSKRFEQHKIKVELTIKEIFLKTGFSGSISFTIKNDNLALSSKKAKYPLENDHCLAYEHLDIQLDNQFDNITQTYQPKDLTIIVNLQSQRGNSVAGFARFSPLSAGNAQKQWQLPLQNSMPDSKIVFSSEYEVLLKKNPAMVQSIMIGDPYNLEKQRKYQKNQKKISAINELIGKQSKMSPKESLISSKIYEKDKFINKTKRVESVKTLGMETKKYIGSSKAMSPKIVHETSEKTKTFDDIDKIKKKIEQQRAEKVRSISKLKMEMSPKLILGQYAKADDTQSSRLKQKLRNLQRKQRNYQLNIQELGNELQKRKSKQLQIQKIKQELERALGEKEIKLRSAQVTIRSLTDQLQNQTTRQRVVSKKGEAKESIFKDQLKRIEERLKLAQQECNQAMNQKNQIIKNTAELQKKHQSALRDRDSKMLQQKGKFMKLKQQWIKQEKQYKFTIQHLQNTVQIITKSKSQMDEKIKEMQAIIIKVNSQSIQLKEILKNQRQIAYNKDQAMSRSQGGQVVSMKKKINQLNTELNGLKDKIKRFQSQKEQNQNKIRELQQNLKSKNSQIGKHTNRINGLKKDVDSSNEQVIRKNKQIENLKQISQNLTAKLNEQKQKFQLQKSRKQQFNKQLDKQTSSFSKQRELLESDLQEQKWIVVRNNDEINDLKYKIKQLNDSILKTNQDLMAKTQRQITMEETISYLQVDNDYLSKEKTAKDLKIKELMENLKIKLAEAEEDKKLKLKAQQRGEEQKERANQIQMSIKERESQQQIRQKQKQQLLKNKLQLIQNLQLQLTKKSQQVTTLKNGNQMILRQMQLTKMDSNGVKNQLNLLESQKNALKNQIINLNTLNQTLNTDLINNKQATIMLVKKNEILKIQFDDYRANVEKALQTLVNEFNKQDGNLSKISTTLFPFQDKKLSTFQIQLIQKRNSFYAKQLYKVSQLQSENNILKNQIKDLKTLFENRETETKKQQNQQRERLKSLLYENMMQKNGLIEELTKDRQEKEQLYRQIQKIKAEINRKFDDEQQLNGQLQILLLQYDGLKAQNQDLSNILFKYKQAEIKMKGEFDQRMLQAQQEHANYVQKIKLESMEKEKKIINSEKQIMEKSQRGRKVQDQLHSLEEEKERLTQTLKNLQIKLQTSNIEITKLNNTVKSYQKSQGQFKQIIDRSEGDLRQIINRNDLLQSSYTKLQNQLGELIIENERLESELTNSKERVTQMDKMLHEKGEISKQKMQKKMEQNSQLKSKLIQKQSEISLKQFYLKQRQQQYQNLSKQNDDLKESINALKGRVKQFIQIRQNNEIKIRDISRQNQQLQHDREQKEQMVTRSSFVIFSLQSEVEQLHRVNQNLSSKERECIRLREEKAEVEQYYIGELKKYRQNIIVIKKELTNQRDYRERVIADFQQNIQKTENNSSQKCKYLQIQFEKQKQQFFKRVEEIQQHNKRFIADLQSRIQRARQQLEQSKQTQKLLIEQGYKKQMALSNQRKRIDSLQNEGQQFKQKYHRYYLMYEESKAEYETMIKDHQEKVISSMQELKLSIEKQFHQKIIELNRKIDTLRHGEEMELKTQPTSRKQLKIIFQRIFSKMGDLVNQIDVKQQYDSFENSRYRK